MVTMQIYYRDSAGQERKIAATQQHVIDQTISRIRGEGGTIMKVEAMHEGRTEHVAGGEVDVFELHRLTHAIEEEKAQEQPDIAKIEKIESELAWAKERWHAARGKPREVYHKELEAAHQRQFEQEQEQFRLGYEEYAEDRPTTPVDVFDLNSAYNRLKQSISVLQQARPNDKKQALVNVVTAQREFNKVAGHWKGHKEYEKVYQYQQELHKDWKRVQEQQGNVVISLERTLATQLGSESTDSFQEVSLNKEAQNYVFAYRKAENTIKAIEKGDVVEQVLTRFRAGVLHFDFHIVESLNDYSKYPTPAKRDRLIRILADEYYGEQIKKSKGTQGFAEFFYESPAGQFGIAVGTSVALGGVGGAITKAFPLVGKAAVTAVGRVGLAYTASTTITEAPKALEGGYFRPFIAQLGVGAAGGILGFKMGWKAGSTIGFRARYLSSIKTDQGRAFAKTMFKAIDKSAKIRTGTRDVFAIGDVKNLTPEQQIKFIKFLESPAAVKFKIVQGGSSSQETFMINKGRPHDIDVLIQTRPFTGVRTALAGKFPRISKYIKPSSKVSDFQKALLDAGFTKAEVFGIKGKTTGLFDIHDLPKPGTSFPQSGTGVTRPPVRTPGGPFRWQMSIQEQLGRKWASALAPLHEFRGKDWLHAMRISAEKWKTTPGTKKLYSELQLYKPQLDPFTGKLIGPSFYAQQPGIAPATPRTWIQRGIAKYGTPVTTHFEPSAFDWIKPTGAPFRPPLPPPPAALPAWLRGITFPKPTTFFSAAIPISTRMSTFAFPTTTGLGYGLGIAKAYRTPTYPTPVAKARKGFAELPYPKLIMPPHKIYIPSIKPPSYPPPHKIMYPPRFTKQPYPPIVEEPYAPQFPPSRKIEKPKKPRVKRTLFDEDKKKKRKKYKKEIPTKFKYREREWKIKPFAFKPIKVI